MKEILSMEEIEKFLNELSEQEENQEDILELENEFNSMEIDNIISEKAE
jgi:flagellar motor switch protein FliM